jgi:hypothetical protein
VRGRAGESVRLSSFFFFMVSSLKAKLFLFMCTPCAEKEKNNKEKSLFGPIATVYYTE